MMTKLSNIGFPISSKDELKSWIDYCYTKGEEIPTPKGTYRVVENTCGAKLYGQFSPKNEVLGISPHFEGKSKRRVSITAIMERPESPMAGTAHAWANPTDENDPESGDYPFLFAVPDFAALGKMSFPKMGEVQLTAFATHVSLYTDAEDFMANREPIESGVKLPLRVFNAPGLPARVEGPPPEAMAVFSGVIREWALVLNSLTQAKFYWLLVDTRGGEVDVVLDRAMSPLEPVTGGVVEGSFWLSGRILNAAPGLEKKKGFWQGWFG